MVKKTRLIPFRWMPGSYGLHGDAYKRAEASYYYDGEALERRMAAIDHAHDITAFDAAMIELDFKYNRIDGFIRDIKLAACKAGGDDPATRLEIMRKHARISEYEYELEKARIDHPTDETALRIALLEIDARHGKANAKEAEKQIATLKGEPWVGLINDGFDSSEGISGFYFEFDWNDAWIVELQRNGYVGMTDDEIMQQWFGDVCRAEAAEVIPQVVPFNSGRVIHRRTDGNGTTEYS